MSVLNDFFSTLSSDDLGLLKLVLEDGKNEASSKRLDAISRQIIKTVSEIDRINRYRDVLYKKVNLLKKVESDVVRKISATTHASLVMLREAISTRIRQMTEEINDSRPTNALEKKNNLLRERDSLVSHKDICVALLKEIPDNG